MNIIFDGNYHFHKTLGVFKSSIEKDSGIEMNLTDLFSEQENRSKFFRKIITDFCHTVRAFQAIEKIDKVIFVFDEPTWRKKKYPWYKEGDKVKDEVDLLIDEANKEGQAHFYKIMSTFQKHVESLGFITSRLLDFEGDDLCYFYATHYAARKQRTVIITGDKDILQSLNKYICVYRNNSLYPAFFYFDSLTMLMIGEKLKEKIKKLVIEEVDPVKHLFVKILKGDKGDNVPSVMKGMGEKTAEKIYEFAEGALYLDCEYDDDDYIAGVATIVSGVVKKSPNEQELCKAIKTNAELMWLDESVYSTEQIIGVLEELDKKSESFTYKGEYQLSEILKQE